MLREEQDVPARIPGRRIRAEDPPESPGDGSRTPGGKQVDLSPAKSVLKKPYQSLTQLVYPPLYAPGTYQLLYIDPPWSYEVWGEGGDGRSASQHYRTMGLSDIKDLPIGKMMARDSVVMMWITGPCFEQGLEVLKAWGYRFKTIGFTWMKRNKLYPGISQEEIELLRGQVKEGMELDRKSVKRLLDASERADHFFMGNGHYSRGNCEYCIIATRGKGLKRVEKGVRSTVTTPIGGHSCKPLEVRRRIDRLFGDVPRIEGFARNRGEGWDCFGWEYDGRDCRESILDFIPAPPPSLQLPLPLFEEAA